MTSAAKNPIRSLLDYGQSVWLDYIRRNLITSGELKRLIDEDGLRGVTSNPAIFEKAIAGSTDYEQTLQELISKDLDATQIYERLAIKDIQDATDAMRGVYDESKRGDGYVSLEVSPLLANDTSGTLDEARRLWKEVGHENVMIKVPATPAGIPAIEQLISEGLNINVTLLFAQKAYEDVAEAYIKGLEKRAARGEDVSKIASVASFFISRIDSLIDSKLTEMLKSESDPQRQALLKSLQGKVAIANGKLTYKKYQEIYSTDRWKALAAKGAQTQRVLWASTSTKNPNYRDVIYVEEMIGKDTVNTIPPATFEAFRDHGQLRSSLTEDVDGAARVMSNLAQAGISMKEVTEKLLVDGVKLFEEAFVKLIGAVDAKIKKLRPPKINRMSYKLSADLEAAVKKTLLDWREGNKVRRLYSRDATVWTNKDESNWLGWIDICSNQIALEKKFVQLGREVKEAGFSHVLLLGMGGSSLCPEVMKFTFGKIQGYPELHVLDSTDPAQVKAFEQKVDLKKTLFIVSSKSGSTLEPNIFKQYFFERAKEAVGEKEVGNRFVAITDPGSKMQQVAEGDHFRHIFFGLASIGGRYSALSDFGMIPAAAMGVDVPKFLDRVEEQVEACAAVVAPDQNPGVLLGAILGTLANHGRDKVTILASPAIHDLGAWLEQLLAESTGKIGKGLIPVDRERIGAPNVYGKDRVFAYLRFEGAPDAEQDRAIETLEQAGQPVVRILVDETYDIGEEFFRWELATAVAGSIIGINPFDQPDVEASKIATRAITSEYEKTGKLPAESPIFEGDGVRLFTDDRNASDLKQTAGANPSLVSYLRAHLNRLKANDYFAVLGYVQMNEAHENVLQSIRHAVRDNKQVATCLGFGPRFLHSTGQAYKGGPNSGVFLQITCDDAADIPVPGQKYTFGVVKAAQARGDFQVLADRKRRALRVHLGSDVAAGLKKLEAAIRQALS